MRPDVAGGIRLEDAAGLADAAGSLGDRRSEMPRLGGATGGIWFDDADGDIRAGDAAAKGTRSEAAADDVRPAPRPDEAADVRPDEAGGIRLDDAAGGTCPADGVLPEYAEGVWP